MKGSVPLRVLVVEDSPVARRLLVSVVNDDPGLRVVGEAADGSEAVLLAGRLRPDVITMDVHMPVMDGVEATHRIMREVPTPIVVVTASDDRAATGTAFGAMRAGALTVVEKPQGPGSAEFVSQAEALRATLKLMAEVKVVTRRARPVSRGEPSANVDASARVDVVALGASTGGPAALATILGALPPEAPVPILVVQHITPGFEESLVRWLDDASVLPVRLATEGAPLRPGEVLVAPQNLHLGIDRMRRVALTDGSPVGRHRPSVSHLFRSVGETYGRGALAVILTGMGDDGVDGLVRLKQSGGWVLAQDEATSAVYGMPKEAAAMGVTDQVLPLDRIASTIVKLWERGRDMTPAETDRWR